MFQKMHQIIFESIPGQKSLRSAKKWYLPYSAFWSTSQWKGGGYNHSPATLTGSKQLIIQKKKYSFTSNNITSPRLK